MLPEKTEGLEICGGSTNRSSFDETCCAYNYNKIWGATHTWLTSTKRFTNLKVNLKRLGLYIGAKMQLVSYEFEYFSVHHDFLGSEGLQGTHIDALNPSSSKLMTLILREGL